MKLIFKNIIVNRRSRVGLHKITIPIPNFSFLNRFTKGNRDKKHEAGPYFEILYLDDDLRIHRTGEGKYFVQTKINS